MSALQLALGIEEEEKKNEEYGTPILSVSQMLYFKKYLARKVATLAEETDLDPLQLQFLRGEISALSLIINDSLAAMNAANQE